MAMRYWEGTGRHQALADELQKLIPAVGPVRAPNSAALNRYRAACNAYHDIFNNGGGNRDDDIQEIFGWRVSEILATEEQDFKSAFRYTEGRMDRIILAAAKEQGLIAQAQGEA